MLLERNGRVGQYVLVQLVLMHADHFVRETATLEFQHAALQFANALLAKQIRRQIPIGALGQSGSDLLACTLTLMVRQLTFQFFHYEVTQFAFVLEIADVTQNSAFISGISNFFTSRIWNSAVSSFPRRASFGASGEILAVARSRFASFGTGECFVEAFDLAIAETQHRSNAQFLFAECRDRFVAILECHCGSDVVASANGSFVWNQATVTAKNLFQLLVDILAVEFANWAFDIKAFSIPACRILDGLPSGIQTSLDQSQVR